MSTDALSPELLQRLRKNVELGYVDDAWELVRLGVRHHNAADVCAGADVLRKTATEYVETHREYVVTNTSDKPLFFYGDWSTPLAPGEQVSFDSRDITINARRWGRNLSAQEVVERLTALVCEGRVSMVVIPHAKERAL